MGIGERIRETRVRLGMTGAELAVLAGVSRSLISKIEREATTPSIDVLRRIAAALDTPVGSLFESTRALEATRVEKPISMGSARVVRSDERKKLILPKSGVVFEMITPDLKGAIEFLWVELEQGEEPQREFQAHQGEECILMLEGCLYVIVDDEEYLIGPGDSITYDASRPHTFRAEGNSKKVWLVVISPPSF